VAATSRLQCLLCDYSAAVECLSRSMPPTGVFSQVFSCKLTLLYHLGFALLMLGRFADATRVLDSLVAPLARLQKTHGGFPTRALPPGAPPSDQVSKAFDRSLTLLVVSHHLASKSSSVSVDDASRQTLKDRFGDKVAASEHRSDRATHVAYLVTLLAPASPKFVVPSSSLSGEDAATVDEDDDAEATTPQKEDAKVALFQQQMRLFSKLASQHLQMAKIKSYLQLYASIPLDKLASFNDTSADDLRHSLLNLKFSMLHKKNQRNAFLGTSTTSDDDLLSTFTPAWTSNYATDPADLHFYVEHDMVHVDEPQADDADAHDFLDQIHKFRQATHLLKLQELDFLAAKQQQAASSSK